MSGAPDPAGPSPAEGRPKRWRRWLHLPRPRRPRRPRRPWLHLPLSRALILVASIAIILLGLLGTIAYNTFNNNRNTNVAAAQQQEISQLKDILAYITGGKQTQAQTEASRWVVKQIQDICAALTERPRGLPGCKLEPVPEPLRQFVNQPPPPPGPTTTTIPP